MHVRVCARACVRAFMRVHMLACVFRVMYSTYAYACEYVPGYEKVHINMRLSLGRSKTGPLAALTNSPPLSPAVLSGGSNICVSILPRLYHLRL